MVQFLHMPPPPSGPAGDFARALVVSHAVEFEALSDTELMLGSAVPHDHELVLGNYAVHISPAPPHCARPRAKSGRLAARGIMSGLPDLSREIAAAVQSASAGPRVP